MQFVLFLEVAPGTKTGHEKMRKTTKSFVAAIVSFVMSVAFLGCGDLSLQELADDMKKDFPKDLGQGLVVKKVELNDNYFVLVSEVDESNQYHSRYLTQDISGSISKNYKDMILNDEGMKAVLKACKKEKKGLKMTMSGNRSGKTVELFKITPEELQ